MSRDREFFPVASLEGKPLDKPAPPQMELPEPQTPLFAVNVDVRGFPLLVLSDVVAGPRVVYDRDREMLVEYYWIYG